MTQRRFHYEQAFEHYLRANRVPYLAVDEAKKALLPKGKSDEGDALKSFDFVVYGPQVNLLVDIKGRMYGSSRARSPQSRGRLESWVTREDVSSLGQWQELFGSGFSSVFVFAYCLHQQPPDALFQEIFTFGGKWYALREVAVEAYRREMVVRSNKWGTVHVPAEAFGRISRPFSLRGSVVSEGETSCGSSSAFVS